MIFWCSGFHTSAAEFCKFNQTAEKMIPFHVIWGLCWYNEVICLLNFALICLDNGCDDDDDDDDGTGGAGGTGG